MKDANQSANKVSYIRQLLKYNDRSTDLDYMEEILLYLPLQCWYGID